MHIARIQGATRELGRPVEWPADKPCLTLPILDTVTKDGEPIMGSAWQPTQEELNSLLRGAHVNLWIWGTGHPPVALTVGEPHPDQPNPLELVRTLAKLEEEYGFGYYTRKAWLEVYDKLKAAVGIHG